MSNGTFAAANLPPGQYVVQVNSKSPPLEGDQYLLIVLAGKNTLVSNAIPGEKFKAAGVAVRVRCRRWRGKSPGNRECARFGGLESPDD